MWFGDRHGGAEVYWNGKKIGSLEPTARLTSFHGNGPGVRPGDNLLALRLFQPDHAAGIVPGPVKFLVETADSPVELTGSWLAKTEFALPTLASGQDTAPLHLPFSPQAQDTASDLYNGMIAPLVPRVLRGDARARGGALRVGRFPAV